MTHQWTVTSLSIRAQLAARLNESNPGPTWRQVWVCTKKTQSQVISRLERTWWQLTDNDHKCFWQQRQLLLFPPASYCSRLPRSCYCTKYQCNVRKRLPLFPKLFFGPVALTQRFLQHGTCSAPATWGAPSSVTSSYIDNSRLINYPFTATSTHVSSAPTKV